MKSVSLIGNNIDVSEDIQYIGTFRLEGEKINVGLVEEENLILKSSSDPDNRVLVKKRGFSCNYRDKTLILNYDNQIKSLGDKGEYTFSYIGSEFVGEVIGIGKNITNLKIGDRVVANASYPSYSADYIAGLPSNHASRRIDDFKENKLIKIPNILSDEIASSFVIAAFTGYSMIRKVVKENAKVLVTAAKSNTSLAVINALRNFPVEVYAMTSSSKNNDMLYEQGVKQVFVIDHNLNDYLEDENIIKFIREKGFFDAVIDPLFDVHLGRVIKLMNYDAKYVTCGLYNQFSNFSETNFKEHGTLNEIIKLAMIKNISIIGNCIGLKEDFDLALHHFERGKFNILIDKIFSIGQEADFFDFTYNFKERLGKVVYLYEN
ncbi:NADPH:quinone reductase [Apibacter mensalis]|uniref:NADPH:quinone reductase n=1 Tax=Apibacter mensalis TaxID=1586267 RepID=A0A0X3AM63_9FLAO|nr:zinc-binding alcohol dehydrogenase family protein [Apibacter mensalis]CVK15323.1 NADPH:quinone reductase [Apibacter mensalis]